MDKLNIPNKINVGFQQRNDTYTGKLAYVIYYDEKGKLRKETSWQGWREKSLGNIELDNTPTSGFVLNKGVGGARESWGWNPRNEYIRVYDPRDFEFEISVANMLYILQECTSTKGKGLQGEFVYSWCGTELVLLPVGTYEYNSSIAFTANKSKKVTKSDMLPGCLYEDKDMNTLMYIGRELCRDDLIFGYYEEDYISTLIDQCTPPKSKKHIFWNVKDETFELHKGFTKLAERLSTDPDPSLVSIHANYIQSNHHCHVSRLQFSTLGNALHMLSPERHFGNRNTSFNGYHRNYGEQCNFFVEYHGTIYAANYEPSSSYRGYRGWYDEKDQLVGKIVLRQSVQTPSDSLTADSLTADVLSKWLNDVAIAFSSQPTHTLESTDFEKLSLYGIEVVYNNSFKQWYKEYVYKYK